MIDIALKTEKSNDYLNINSYPEIAEIAVDCILGIYQNPECNIESTNERKGDRLFYISKTYECFPVQEYYYLKCFCKNISSEECCIITFKINSKYFDELFWDSNEENYILQMTISE
jgi:hypothetical protein